jgi:DNA-binding winged helix-turn-helix (wHTH) protein
MAAPARIAQYAFGNFQFDGDTRRLTRDGQAIRLGPRAADVLLVLLENAGRVVTRDDLIAKAWNGASVERQNLTVQIHEIRDALSDDPETPFYIKTIARRGYQFICPVTLVVEDADVHGNAAGSWSAAKERIASEPRPSESSWLQRAAVVSALLVTSVLAIALIDSRKSSLPGVLRITQLTHDGMSKSAPLLGGGSLYYRTGRKQYALRLDSGVTRRVEALDPYTLLDVSSSGGDALAVRPDDRGAESALWTIRLDGSGARRVGAVVVGDHAAAGWGGGGGGRRGGGGAPRRKANRVRE